QDQDAKQVYWRSRRGLLELDLVLLPFTQDCYFNLPKIQQKLYKEILDLEDLMILDLIHDRTTIPEEFQQVIQLIREHLSRN
ncbi:MAG: succinate dehydrogenase assembly factor 2, partial [Gammaproteobacteria bacterium]|nr:succinate dehydrogenase assembly factor 2 [Gammaproteobacteria bacterium]